MTQTDTAADNVADRTLTMIRVIDVPARFIFKAFTSPEHVMRWYGPRNYPLTQCEMDFRVGGGFRFAMGGTAEAPGTPFGGTYLVIEPDTCIVYDNGFLQDGAEKMVVTTRLHEIAGRTTVSVQTVFASLAMKDLHVGMGYEFGVAIGFDQLAVVAAELASA